MKALLNALYAALALASALPPSVLAQPDAGRLSPAQTAQATDALARWLECTRCSGGELKAVAQYGQGVVPMLIASLQGGLSPATREMRRALLATRYDELDAQSRKNPKFAMKSTKDEFVARYLENFDAGYRIRAAQALAAVGGAKARDALKAALGSAKREDVRGAIQESLGKIR